MRLALALLAALAATSIPQASSAAPREIRDGANHHLGDDSFVARFGRAPTRADAEELRMHVHLEYVRDLLAQHPATSPELAGRRAELLGYLGDYITAGTTPRNTYVPWRSPVFIDASGQICAVGYLIERSVGRALPERIAASHRLSYLEDIAAAMPEVASWVASSGLTLDELASIQPGYEGPDVQFFVGFDPKDMKDGTVHLEQNGVTFDGAFKHKQMVGPWKRTAQGGKLLGSGTFRAGAGTWKSMRSDGTKLAEGAFVDSSPEGEWRFFHPSGRLAAIGRMHAGQRDGAWTFFYDAAGSPKLSSGRFVKGEVMGDWSHFAAGGKLVATAHGQAWAPTGLTLDIVPGADGVRHTITQGKPASDRRLDALFLGGDTLYIWDRTEMYDRDGNRLEKVDGAWTAQACRWSARRKRIAAAGDVFTLFKMAPVSHSIDDRDETDDCSDQRTAVPAAKAKHYDAMLASRSTVHAPIPAWNIKPEAAELPGEAGEEAAADAAMTAGEDEPGDETEGAAAVGWPAPIPGDNPKDMATYLAEHMHWYMEWPHVDGTFRAVYQSLPGYASRYGS